MTDDPDPQSTEEAPSDDRPDADAATVADGPADAGSAPDGDGPLGPLDDTDRVQRGLLWAGVGLLALLSAVALLRVYTNTSAAIARFVAPDFQPVFQATFNLAVLLLAVAGIGLLLRRLQATA